MNGITMPLEKLYPPVNFPVSRGTAKISPILRWDHSATFLVSKSAMDKTSDSGERVKINLTNEKYAYMAGNTIDGNNVVLMAFILKTKIYFKVDVYFRPAAIWSLSGLHLP